MGNTIKHATDYLRDPYLVRRIQETFGVREIVIPQASETAPSSANESTAKENGRVETNGGLMNGGLEWLTSVKVRRRLKHSPSISPCESISSSPSTSDSETPEFPSNIVIESVSLLDIYFRFATELGYEPFYITFLPSIFWNFDSHIARHVVILWCISMYVGQACKAVFKWRRPSSPPVFRLEDNPKIETEYGFPSTHAIVSTIIPFYFLYSFDSRYEFPLWPGVLIAVTWWSSVCFSRIYLGVHTVLDAIGGIIIALLLMAIVIPGLTAIDYLIFHSPYTPAVIIAITIILLYIYPVEPDRWTMDRGDTAAIWGVGMGVTLGLSFHGPYPDDLVDGPFIVTLPSLEVISMTVIRFVVGILLLVPVRFLMKLFCFKLLPAIMPTHGVEEVVKRPLVELPYKIITYGTIGFTAAYVAPVVFEICNISRWEEGVAWG